MNQLEALQIFVRVAELASFTAAAESLGLPRANASLAVQQLESLLGTRLLHRTTRKVQMTQDGLVVYERSRDLLADMDELQSLFRTEGAMLRGRLRVDMPAAVAREVVIPALPEFLSSHPGLEVELSSTDRRVDLVREGFDCVLRVGVLGDSSLIARSIGAYRMVNCVSPGYIARFGAPEKLDDLVNHQLIHYVPSLGGRSAGFEYVDPGDERAVHRIPMKGIITVNSTEAYVTACVAGFGIVQSPEASMRALFQSGALVEVLPQFRAPSMPVSLVYANRRHLPRRVRIFMDWIEALMRPRLVA